MPLPVFKESKMYPEALLSFCALSLSTSSSDENGRMFAVKSDRKFACFVKKVPTILSTIS